MSEQNTLLPVILAGGSGTRLWPLSRKHYAKQYLALGGDKTMLQEMVARLGKLAHLPPLLICNEDSRFLAAEQMRQMDRADASILLEPAGRNTAPAIALGALMTCIFCPSTSTKKWRVCTWIASA
jgi:mannose-1-phosphate guanylyltransferase